jgi:DNA-binding NtrC family response regulator
LVTVTYGVLVVGSEAEVTEVRAAAAGAGGARFRGLTWKDVCADGAGRGEAVVVAMAGPAETDALRALAARLRKPVLALVPREGVGAVADWADDFMVWPGDPAELAGRIERLARAAGGEVDAACRRLSEELALAQLVGSEPCFVAVVRQIALFAKSNMPVLIAGETGTGKELCARALHFLGPRRNGPFVAVDCSAIPDHLFENELFGHMRGAYTDAHGEQKGLVALSDRGTLLLDEIDSLSPSAQGKLLRFLQERTYKPLGAEKFVRADVNVLAATNRDLEAVVRQKAFRADLYYRLNVLQLRMPPLRERRGDIPLLARHFLAAACERMQVTKTLSPQAVHKLAGYAWPGNVRELLNQIQRAAVLAEGEVVLPCHLEFPGEIVHGDAAAETFRAARTQSLEMFERGYVQDMLARHDGNITQAAREAGKERRAFGRLVKKYRLAGRS